MWFKIPGFRAEAARSLDSCRFRCAGLSFSLCDIQMRLFLVFLIVPLVEIALFVQIGGAIGLLGTLAVVVVTGILGAALLRSQGRAILSDVRNAVSGGGDVSAPVVQGALIGISGLLLLTPGFFTDAAGFALLIPKVRRDLIRWCARVIVPDITARHRFPERGPDDSVIDGVAHVVGQNKPHGPGQPED